MADPDAIATADPTEAPDLGLAVSVDSFSGPLDLLLFLVRKDELDIRDIPLAGIADQFVVLVRAWQERGELDLEVAGDFILMAATLLEIKARAVAPLPVVEGEDAADDGEDELLDPRQGLIGKLLAYRRFKEAVGFLTVLEEERALRHTRRFREELPEDPEEAAGIDLGELDSGLLFTLWDDLLKRLGGKGPRTVLKDDIPLEDTVQKLVEAARATGTTTLGTLLQAEPGLLGRVTLLMATLETARKRVVEAKQREQYGDVDLRFRPDEERNGPPPELPPEVPWRKRQRKPPLVTYTAIAAGEEEEGAEPEPEAPYETDEQRFLRELNERCDLDGVLARSVDVEGGFLEHWYTLFPEKRPKPPEPELVVPVAEAPVVVPVPELVVESPVVPTPVVVDAVPVETPPVVEPVAAPELVAEVPVVVESAAVVEALPVEPVPETPVAVAEPVAEVLPVEAPAVVEALPIDHVPVAVEIPVAEVPVAVEAAPSEPVEPVPTAVLEPVVEVPPAEIPVVDSVESVLPTAPEALPEATPGVEVEPVATSEAVAVEIPPVEPLEAVPPEEPTVEPPLELEIPQAVAISVEVPADDVLADLGPRAAGAPVDDEEARQRRAVPGDLLQEPLETQVMALCDHVAEPVILHAVVEDPVTVDAVLPNEIPPGPMVEASAALPEVVAVTVAPEAVPVVAELPAPPVIAEELALPAPVLPETPVVAEEPASPATPPPVPRPTSVAPLLTAVGFAGALVLGWWTFRIPAEPRPVTTTLAEVVAAPSAWPPARNWFAEPWSFLPASAFWKPWPPARDWFALPDSWSFLPSSAFQQPWPPPRDWFAIPEPWSFLPVDAFAPSGLLDPDLWRRWANFSQAHGQAHGNHAGEGHADGAHQGAPDPAEGEPEGDGVVAPGPHEE